MTNEWTFQPTSRPRTQGARRSLEDRMAALSRTPIFAGLPKRHLKALAKESGHQHFPAGKVLVAEGQVGSVFYAIVEGTTRVSRGGRTVKRLGPGDFFGEMSILTKSPRSASVTADTPVECVTLPASGLRSVLLTESKICFQMLTTIAERLEEMDRKIL